MHNLLTVSSKFHNYSVYRTNTIKEVEQLMEEPNTFTIIDKTVEDLYPSLCKPSNISIIANETAKTLEGVGHVIELLISKKANVKSKLVAIGGGVVQDLVGFVASIYCRGIDYTIVPTTLLAQADSCIGGKTSINHANRKNIVGTFYPPTKIVLLHDFIDTLSPIDYISGWGEIYKFHILQGTMSNFSLDDSQTSVDSGLRYKASVLALDEFDQRERKFLNFGHTFGHALESVSDYALPHGLAVIIGSMIACRISHKLGLGVKDRDIIDDVGLSLLRKSGITVEKWWFDFSQLSEIIMSDKKSTGNLTMVLIDSNPDLVIVEDFRIVEESLNEIYESIRLRN